MEKCEKCGHTVEPFKTYKLIGAFERSEFKCAGCGFYFYIDRIKSLAEVLNEKLSMVSPQSVIMASGLTEK